MVTGATKGIGKAVVEELIRWGAQVYLIAREETLLLEQLKQYQQQGAQVKAIAADMSTQAGRASLLSYMQDQGDQAEIIINNVGSNIRKKTLETLEEDFRKLMQINVESAFELSKAFYPQLLKAEHPNIINVSSIASQRVVRLTTALYSMSKAAMEQMTNYLAVEWGKEGIRVNSVHPWFIETPLTKTVLEDQEKLAAINRQTPLGRVGRAEEVANAIVFLASPAASYITGVNLQIDGGFSKVGVM